MKIGDNTDITSDPNAPQTWPERADLTNMERKALLNLLRAPYMRSHAWAITNACALLDHPDKYDEGAEPKFTLGGCPCGYRKGEA